MYCHSEHFYCADSVVFNHQFDDIDNFIQAIQPLSLNANQLSCGRFIGSVNVADFKDLKFTHITHNQHLRATGLKSSDDLIFVMVVKGDQTQVLAHGFPVQKRDLFGFDTTQEIDIVIGKQAQLLIVSINFQLFQSIAEVKGYHNLGQQLLKQNFLRCHPLSLRPLKFYYQQMAQLFLTQPSILKQAQVQSLIMATFPSLLIDTLGKIALKNKPSLKTLSHYSLIKKAEAIMRSSFDQPLTLEQLCQALKTSSSVLACGFQEIFGLSPMSYLKIQRLNGVRRALKLADPQTTTVMKTAQQWGFWNPGHFSQDYQHMFEELPSVTLVKNKS